MNMDQLKEFVSLEKCKKELDSELKAIAARLDDLEQALVPQFLTDGVNSLKINGRVVYLAEDIYASPINDRLRSSPPSRSPSWASTSRRTTTRNR